MAKQKNTAEDSSKESTKEKEETTSQPTCGIIMPISEIDGCSAGHWKEVLGIIKDVAAESNFDTDLVSESETVGVIQKRIIQNVYESDIVICDVSCMNPNVMFELGMRLAFDKATIIIKDEITEFNFDTGSYEHLVYPRELRYNSILLFKAKLGKKLKATYFESLKDGYSAFLKDYGTYELAHLSSVSLGIEEMLPKIWDEVISLRRTINNTVDRSQFKDPDALVKARKKVALTLFMDYVTYLRRTKYQYDPEGLNMHFHEGIVNSDLESLWGDHSVFDSWLLNYEPTVRDLAIKLTTKE